MYFKCLGRYNENYRRALQVVKATLSGHNEGTYIVREFEVKIAE